MEKKKRQTAPLYVCVTGAPPQKYNDKGQCHMSSGRSYVTRVRDKKYKLNRKFIHTKISTLVCG